MRILTRRSVSAPLPFYAEFGEPLGAWRIMDNAGHVLDVVRSGLSAMADVDSLNAGRAHVDRHACLGCRVVLDPA